MPAVFFDFDGTLCDTRGDLAAAVNHTRQDFDLEPLPLDAVIANVGLGAKYLLKQCLKEVPAASPVDFDELFQQFMAHYLEHCCDTVTLYPGVRETLEEFSTRGVKMGLNTAKPRTALEMILRHLQLSDYFGEAIIAAGDSPEMKPSALPLKLCAEKLGHTLTADDWMVGDNWTDVGSGSNAGIKTAYCDFGFGTLKDFIPTVHLSTFSDLLENLIKQVRPVLSNF